MDFVEGLPKSQSFNSILVVIDKFSKYAHFLPLAHPYTALSVAQLYFHNIYKLHGLPEAIITDREDFYQQFVAGTLQVGGYSIDDELCSPPTN
jgi:protoheme ferro-lyase